jgi:hypothetical protein
MLVVDVAWKIRGGLRDADEESLAARSRYSTVGVNDRRRRVLLRCSLLYRSFAIDASALEPQ